MERVRTPDSVLLLVASLVHLMAMMITHFMHWHGFVNENIDDFDEQQFNLLSEHLTHLLTFLSFLWLLLLRVLTMSSVQDFALSRRTMIHFDC